jgi:hypothetical protein
MDILNICWKAEKNFGFILEAVNNGAITDVIAINFDILAVAKCYLLSFLFAINQLMIYHQYQILHSYPLTISQY